MTDSINSDFKKNASSSLTKINVVLESPNNKSEQVKEENKSQASSKTKAKEFGGRAGLEPTRFGDWEKNGRCIDF